MSAVELERRPLPVGSIGTRSTGWWAMVFIITSEAAIFAFLQFSYYYLALQHESGPWPPEGLPKLHLSLPNTAILLLSSVAVWWGERSIKRGRSAMLSIGLAVGLALGIAFVAIQAYEWVEKPFNYNSHPYGSLYYTITGFHMAHVVAGLLMLAGMLAWSLMGYFNAARHAAISTGALYWHFVDAVWLTIFFTFYVLPYLR